MRQGYIVIKTINKLTTENILFPTGYGKQKNTTFAKFIEFIS